MPRSVVSYRALVWLPLAAWAAATAARAAEPTAEELEFFEKKIRPVLVRECYECHSAEAAKANKLRGGLALDLREAARRGGESGPAVVPGNVEQSLLISALKHDSYVMPPTKKLSNEVIADFEQWIRRGAPDPRDGAATVTAAIDYDRARREHWSFQPLGNPTPPTVRHAAWVRNDVDRFLLAKLEAAGLQPSPEADPATLLRRVYFDLIGLPPSVEEVEAFVRDFSPSRTLPLSHSRAVDGEKGRGGEGEMHADAYAAVVDRLLASPQYGERWGRHWLDLARYADSSGFHNDLDRPTAWRYRDYVIDAFNQDKPYARFVAEQLAGDELDDACDATRIATGFNCNGPSNEDNMGVGKFKEQYRLDQLDDVISTTATVFLGLTVGCARCHDHKIDPIAAEDYYRLLAVFGNAEKVGGPTAKKPKKGEEDKQPKFQAFVETSAKAKPTYLLRRGNLDFRGAEVQPGVPTIAALRPVVFATPAKDAPSTGRRRQLAEWIADPANPLSYRVLANRLWQHHFGRGIVATPSNFGRGGARPTHPELLDYLAQQIIADGGRLKATHRLIVTSAAYRQSGMRNAEFGMRSSGNSALRIPNSALSIDPDNHLLSHMPLRRLEAEALRDAVLAISGKLNLQQGGPGIKPRIRAELLDASQRNKWPVLEREGPEQWRRSVYIYIKRQLLMPMMELFDAPTASETVAARSQSVVPTQALLLMNDEFIEEQARYAAERVLRESEGDVPRAIERLSIATLARRPSSARSREAMDFVRRREDAYVSEGSKRDEARLRAVADLAHVLFNSNEFVYVE
jgi:hypothetical protein